MPTEISLLHIITDDYYHVIKDYEKDGDGAKKGGKKGGKASAAKADKKGGGKKSMKDGGKGGKKPKSKSKDNDSDDGGGGGGGGKKDREGWATDPKPKPIKPTIENPSLPDDKYGIERILKLVTCYEDPDYGGCTISGLLSSDMVLLMIKKTHLLDSVLNHPCTLVAKHEGRIIGICLCTDKGDEEWEAAWAHLKATFSSIADRDEILKQVYEGDDRQAGKTCQIHQLAVDSRFRRMTVGSQLVKACVKKADDERFHRVSIVCTDAFSEKIVKKLKFQSMGEPLHYKKFTHPKTGALIYKCIYKKPHKKMRHYALRF